MKVARRAIVLSVITCRGFSEGFEDKEEGADLVRRSIAWLDSLAIDQELCTWERSILSTPFGHLSEKDIIKASWLCEGLVVLAWALNRADILSYDIQCDPPEVANSLGYLQPINDTVLIQPSLRSIKELSDYNDFIYNLHWRVRNFGKNRNIYDCEHLLSDSDGGHYSHYGLKLKEKDVEISGKPLSLSTEEEYRSLAGITQERHRASNWLVGYDSEDFYEVATDT